MSDKVMTMPKEINGYIKIENQGEIDINALLLLGATSKRGDDTKIGFFGSGLKYAIAVLLKNNIGFHIFAGEKEIKVTTVEENFRGTKVNVIKVNNRKTSLTTDMGPDWKAWFAIREIYCNAIDEGEHEIGITNEITPVKGKTIFFVKFDYQLAELFSNWNLYFSDKRQDIVAELPEHGTTVFSGNKDKFILYRKGVRCHEDRRKCLYHYDCTWIKINESRTIDNLFDAQYNLPKVWGKGATVEMISEFFNNYSDTVEKDFQWSNVSFYNKAWLEAINGRTLIIDSVAGFFMEELASNREKFLILPSTVVESLKSYFGNRVTVKGMSEEEKSGDKEVTISPEQVADITFAIDFLKKGGVDVTAPIKVWEFNDSDILGKARNGEIRLSTKVFKKGRREVIATVLEENCHLDSGYGDKTLRFQNFLMNMLINSMEEKSGVRV